MKWPSLDLADASRQAARTLRRFAPALLCAGAAFGLALLLINEDWWKDADTKAPGYYEHLSAQRDRLSRLLLVAVTGIPLFTGARLFAEQARLRGRAWAGYAAYAVLAAGLAGLAGYAYPAPADDTWVYEQLAFLHVAAQAWAAVAAYLLGGREEDFWQQNRGFFIRFFTSTLYAGTLWIGLAGALGVTNLLFKLELRGEAFGDLFASLALLFHPLFFLAGVPAATALQAPEPQEYPKPLKAFAQFVLLPLVLIYLLILYAYMGRILVLQDWPQGIVSWLVFGFAVAGVLAFLLLWPLRQLAGADWVRRFTRFFYLALLPLIALEALALYKRIDAYGLTPERVVLLVLTAWLAGITLAGLATGGRRIRFIPASLAVALLLVCAGPLDAQRLSVASQHSRMEAWFTRHGMLPGGHLRPYAGPDTLHPSSLADLESQMDFLAYHKALRPALTPWFAPDTIPIASDDGDRDYDASGREDVLQSSAIIRHLIAQRYLARWDADKGTTHTLRDAFGDGRPMRLLGAQYLIASVRRTDSTETFVLPGEDTLRLERRADSTTLTLRYREHRQRMDLRAQCRYLNRHDSLPDSLRAVPLAVPGLRGHAYINTMYVRDTGSTLPHVSFFLLIK